MDLLTLSLFLRAIYIETTQNSNFKIYLITRKKKLEILSKRKKIISSYAKKIFLRFKNCNFKINKTRRNEIGKISRAKKKFFG